MLKGTFPEILKKQKIGEEARKLYDDALGILDEIINHQWLTIQACVGFFPAQSNQDDVLIYKDENHREPIATFHFLRQQGLNRKESSNYCLADFIAPLESGVKDYLGLFAVTAGIGLENLIMECDKNHDDYRAIMVKALADRLAEASAEYLHELVRKELWGYAARERLGKEELIKEAYTGIRPAPGYPACPDHTEKQLLFDLLEVESKIEMKLTENYAMYPAAAVSGFYFSNPAARYFKVGSITQEQAEDYAKRKGWLKTDIERWLSSNLSYNN